MCAGFEGAIGEGDTGWILQEAVRVLHLLGQGDQQLLNNELVGRHIVLSYSMVIADVGRLIFS